MSVILGASILIRLVGVAYSIWLLYWSKDRRFGFLTVMLVLMSVRQLWTFFTEGGGGLEELPGFVVSLLAVATVHYLSQYVVEEDRITNELTRMNNQLRSFKKAVEQAGHAIILTDPKGQIEYANPATEEITGYRVDESIGENPQLWQSGVQSEDFYETLWTTITGGTIWSGELINRRKDGEHFWVDATIAPVTDENGTIQQFVAVEQDITERKQRELQLDEQNRRLESLNTTNEILRDVNRELVRADSKEEIESAVCNRFVDSKPYTSAWIATKGVVSETVVAQTSVGLDDESLATVLTSVNDTQQATPVNRALESETTQMYQIESAGTAAQDVQSCVDASGTIAIPLSYRAIHYGALVLHANDITAMETVDKAVLDELGETIAYAINAVERRQTMVSDRQTELAFTLTPEDDPLISLSAALGSKVELKRVSTDDDGKLSSYVRLAETSATAIQRAVETTDDIGSFHVLLTDDSGSVVLFTAIENSVIETLTECGASVDALEGESSSGSVTATVSVESDVRSVADAVKSTHPSAGLTKRSERTRTPVTRGQFRAHVEHELTKRQFEAVQFAFFGGYFHWPRDTSGEELAEKMGVSQSTYLQHLRAGQQKFFEAFFARETL